MYHHSMVNLRDASPTSFVKSFYMLLNKKNWPVRCSTKTKYNKLDRQSRWFTETTTFNDNRSVTFSTPGYDDQVDIPAHYKTILKDVSREINLRHNYVSPNNKLQLVKKNAADDVFKNTHYLIFFKRVCRRICVSRKIILDDDGHTKYQ
jgi:hypothetical protein